MIKRRIVRSIALWLALASPTAPAGAVTLTLDYTYDTTNFFGVGNPGGISSGLQAKASLESAASFFSSILNDTLSPIQAPPTYHSSVFGGQVTWHWTMNFNHPTTGDSVTINDAVVAADQYMIFAGARSLSGLSVGQGGPGGYGWSSNPSGGFTAQEIGEIQTITDQFQSAVEHRGETSGFANWGATIAFDRDGSTNWHFDHTTQPSAAAVDFYSVVIHELAHALGFGTSFDFQSLVSGAFFTGTNSRAQHGGSPVPLSVGLAHWANGTASSVFGSSTVQIAALDPTLPIGVRKRLTELDAAALQDIGWDVVPTVVPEPAGMLLAVMAGIVAPYTRSRRRG